MELEGRDQPSLFGVVADPLPIEVPAVVTAVVRTVGETADVPAAIQNLSGSGPIAVSASTPPALPTTSLAVSVPTVTEAEVPVATIEGQADPAAAFAPAASSGAESRPGVAIAVPPPPMATATEVPAEAPAPTPTAIAENLAAVATRPAVASRPTAAIEPAAVTPNVQEPTAPAASTGEIDATATPVSVAPPIPTPLADVRTAESQPVRVSLAVDEASAEFGGAAGSEGVATAESGESAPLLATGDAESSADVSNYSGGSGADEAEAEAETAPDDEPLPAPEVVEDALSSPAPRTGYDLPPLEVEPEPDATPELPADGTAEPAPPAEPPARNNGLLAALAGVLGAGSYWAARRYGATLPDRDDYDPATV